MSVRSPAHIELMLDVRERLLSTTNSHNSPRSFTLGSVALGVKSKVSTVS